MPVYFNEIKTECCVRISNMFPASFVSLFVPPPSYVRVGPSLSSLFPYGDLALAFGWIELVSISFAPLLQSKQVNCSIVA